MVIDVLAMSVNRLLRPTFGLLHIIDARLSHHLFYRDFFAHTHKWHVNCISSSGYLSQLRFWAPCQYRHVRQLVSDSSDSSSSSETDSDVDELCVYQPDVRRIRIVTMNDVQTDNLMHDAASAHSSVQRDTVYIRQHVSADDPTVQSLFQGICEGSRSSLACAITLIESVHLQHRAQAQVLLREVLEYTRKKRRHSLHRVNSFRIGNVFMSHDVVDTTVLWC